MFIDDLLDLMPDTVIVEPLVSRDSYGAATYGSPTSYQARVNFKQRNILGPDNQIVTSRGTVWMACSDPITTEARVTLPDGTTPLILVSNGENDETGVTQFYRLDFQ